MERWQETSLCRMRHSTSDHCSILLRTTETNWGPSPFRFMNALDSHLDFLGIIEASWKDNGIEGWGSFVFMGKMKRLEERLKNWNRESFGIMEQKIQSLQEESHSLDLINDNKGLSEEEARCRNEKSPQLLLLFYNMKSLLVQIAKLKWLKEGDVNTRSFQKAIKTRRFSNNIPGLEVDGEWTEELIKVKLAISEHFRL